MVEFDIVALRSDQDAHVDWLADSIKTATTESMSSSSQTVGHIPPWRRPKPAAKPQRRHPLYRAGSSRLQKPGTSRKGTFDMNDPSVAGTFQGGGAGDEPQPAADATDEDLRPDGVDGPVFDIVALREDSSAHVEWLDMGFASSTLWQFLKEKLSMAPAWSRSRTTTAGSESMTSQPSSRSRGGVGTRRRRLREQNSEVIQDVATAASALCPARFPAAGEWCQDTESTPSTSAASDALQGPVDERLQGDRMRIQTEVFLKRTSTAGSQKECSLCQGPHAGFGQVCPTCRALGPRGSIQTCRLCNHFFQGFTDTCGDCKA